MAGLFVRDAAPDGGQPVLLLHGLGADGSSWGYQLPSLTAAGFRPLAVDVPGFGQSVCAHSPWTVPGASAQVADWYAAQGLGSAAVVGISMGGAVALQLALDHPALCGRLVLVNTFACLRPKRWYEARYLLGRFVRARLRGVAAQAGMVAQRIFPYPEQAELRAMLIDQILRTNPLVYRQAMRSLGMYDARKRLHTLQCPTLVISGDQDTTVPLENQADLAAGIPGAQHIFIPNAGHAVIADQPEAFNRTLLSFLQVN